MSIELIGQEMAVNDPFTLDRPVSVNPCGLASRASDARRRWEPLQLLLFSFARRRRPTVRPRGVACVYRRLSSMEKCVKIAHGGRLFPE